MRGRGCVELTVDVEVVDPHGIGRGVLGMTCEESLNSPYMH
ncbi:hypothetical protein FACS189472_14860 [Alphaproteobacteria bacterium]|nr:hypothetical protein FACS189472_14860 [Alphaproteobacteria bacterium]